MNFQLVAVVLYLIISNVACNKNLRIVGGIDADIQEFPYTVSIRLLKRREVFCAGAIISNWHVITAAHCFDNLRLSQIGIFIGTTYSKDYSVPCHKICNVNVHPKYIISKEMEKKAQYDIAIAMVRPSITFNEFHNKIKLPNKDVQHGEVGILTGWGRTSYPEGQLSNALQKTCMTIVTNNDCAKYIPFKIYNEQVCAFQKQGVGACYGDSGAPLVIDGKLIGVSSFVRPCATGEPDVYIRVFSHIDFITKSMSNLHNPSCTII